MYLGLGILLGRHSLMSRVESHTFSPGLVDGSIGLPGISVTFLTTHCPLEIVVGCVPYPLALLEPVSD